MFSKSREQYIGLVIGFKQKCRIHKSDIMTCGTARYLNNKHCDPSNKHIYLKEQSIEQVFDNNNNGCNIETFFWEREKYWQTQLFTILYDD